MAVTSRRVSLIGDQSVRSYTASQITTGTTNIWKDSVLYNCYIEQQSGGQARIKKRGGLTQDRLIASWQTDLSTWDVTAGNINGAFWSDNESFYRVVGTTAYKDSTSITGITTAGTGTPAYFADLDTGTKYVLVYDADKLWTVTGTTGVEVTDTDFTSISSKVGGVVVLDGYVFIMDSNGTIYNSAVDDPTAWAATDFISAEIEADSGQYLSKHLNYVLAFGDRTLEIFYNAANATGSPLSRVSSAVIRIGCRTPASVKTIGTETYWVGTLDDGDDGVYVLEGLSPRKISTPAIDKFLSLQSPVNNPFKASIVQLEGTIFYVIHNRSITSGPDCYAYNTSNGTWTSWGSGSTIANADSAIFAYSYGVMAGNESSLICGNTDGKVYRFSNAYYQDNGTDFVVRIQTDKIDFGTVANKFLHRLEVIGDKPGTSTDVAISWTDDDYQTFSTPRNVDMDKESPVLFRCGKFKRRAFRLDFVDNYPLSLEGLELTGELGEQAEGSNT